MAGRIYPDGATPSKVARLRIDGKFPTKDGRAQFVYANWEPFPEQPTMSTR